MEVATAGRVHAGEVHRQPRRPLLPDSWDRSGGTWLLAEARLRRNRLGRGASARFRQQRAPRRDEVERAADPTGTSGDIAAVRAGPVGGTLMTVRDGAHGSARAGHDHDVLAHPLGVATAGARYLRLHVASIAVLRPA